MTTTSTKAVLLSALFFVSACEQGAKYSDYQYIDQRMEIKLDALRIQDAIPAQVSAEISGLKTIAQVNDYVNTMPYHLEDEGDVWKKPDEFFRDGGDCEDFAIAKFHALKANHDSKVIVLRSKKQPGLIHAVLLVDGAHVLDNLRPDIYGLSELRRKWDIMYAADPKGVRFMK